MKKIKITLSFKLLALMLIAYSLPLIAQDYDSVASYTSKTTIGTTDIIPFQTKISNKFTWRKMIGSNLWNQITDTTEARITALLNASNSWNGINNFDGATFNAGSHGGVTVNDSLFMGTGATFYTKLQRPGTAGGSIGSASLYYTAMYSQNFVVINSGGTDSAYISLDADGNISIPNLTVTETVVIDSGAAFRQVVYEPHTYLVPAVSDTVLRLNAANKYSLIMIDLPGNVTAPGISHFDVDEATVGFIIRLVNSDATFTITFKDLVGNDDNIKLNGGADFTGMAQYEYLELMCVDATADDQLWIETGKTEY